MILLYTVYPRNSCGSGSWLPVWHGLPVAARCCLMTLCMCALVHRGMFQELAVVVLGFITSLLPAWWVGWVSGGGRLLPVLSRVGGGSTRAVGDFFSRCSSTVQQRATH